MSGSIEEQIAKILADAPTMEDHVAPFQEQISQLEKQFLAAKTNPKRKAILRELKKCRRYVSQCLSGKKSKRRQSQRQERQEKATERKLRWLARRLGKNRV